MVRRSLFFSAAFVLLGMLLSIPGRLLAAPGNSITFLSVTSTNPDACTYTINDSIQVSVRVSVAPNVQDRFDLWTISNPMGMSMSMGTRILAVGPTGKVFDGSMWMPVPDGTMPGDLLTISVQMTSTINGKIITQTVKAAFNCSTLKFVTGSGSSSLTLRFTDGRLNQEPEQSVTIYPTGKGGYDLYAVDRGVGALALRMTKAQLNANPDKGTNYLIAENLGVRLYRLAGGFLEVQRLKPDGKYYVFTWKG